MRRTYAKEITKEYLKRLGVEFVSTDGETVIIKGKTVKLHLVPSGKKHYKHVTFYDPEIRAGIPEEKRTNASGQFTLGVHVVNYVWNKGDRPEGMVVDHIDNDPFNNHIDNLQLLTPRENVNKDKKERPPRIVKMPKYITLEEIDRKLTAWEEFYEQAKKDKDADAAHKCRSNLSNWRAKKRMFLEDPEKYTRPIETITEHPCHARAIKRKELRSAIYTTHKAYKEALNIYSLNNPITIQNRANWKRAIAEYNEFCDETKKARAI